MARFVYAIDAAFEERVSTGLFFRSSKRAPDDKPDISTAQKKESIAMKKATGAAAQQSLSKKAKTEKLMETLDFMRSVIDRSSVKQ